MECNNGIRARVGAGVARAAGVVKDNAGRIGAATALGVAGLSMTACSSLVGGFSHPALTPPDRLPTDVYLAHNPAQCFTEQDAYAIGGSAIFAQPSQAKTLLADQAANPCSPAVAQVFASLQRNGDVLFTLQQKADFNFGDVPSDGKTLFPTALRTAEAQPTVANVRAAEAAAIHDVTVDQGFSQDTGLTNAFAGAQAGLAELEAKAPALSQELEAAQYVTKIASFDQGTGRDNDVHQLKYA